MFTMKTVIFEVIMVGLDDQIFFSWCIQVLKTDKDKEESKHEEEMAELMDKHAKELQDLGKFKE